MSKTLAHVAKALPGHYWLEITFMLEPRDMWIGLYWKRYPKAIDLYFCVLPCVVLEIYVENQR
jgi:hypothetical protein